MARAEDGSFRFGVEEPPWTCPETVDLDVANDELARLLDEWREIQAVIPSLECRIRLCEELGIDQLVVDRERWRLLTAIDGRRSVRELVRTTNRPVLDVCHAIVALVDAGAVRRDPAARRGRGQRPLDRRQGEPGRRRPRDSVRSRRRVAAPGPRPAVAAAEDDADAPPAEKGQYLRVFSALREN